MAEDDDFFDKALEGFAMFALNQGEVCTCPSRALIQEAIYDRFMERGARARRGDQAGQPARHRHHDRRAGLQRAAGEDPVLHRHRQAGRRQGAHRRRARRLGGDLAGGYYVQPTVFEGHNKMRIFQEEIFGPVVSVTTFKDDDDALAIANDTLYGLGAGVWSRDGNTAYRFGRAIQAGRVWTNCYHAYPAHAAFGGYKQSGIGRENHKMMLDHYQQTKNLLVSYSPKKLGFFYEELDFHLAMVTRDLVERGQREPEARAEALRRFGDLAQVGAERCRHLDSAQRQHERNTSGTCAGPSIWPS
jgi:aldehyde dehydrogenase